MRSLFRIIDVNINRLTEGLRVTEEVVRFEICDKQLLTTIRKIHNRLTRKLKDYRFSVIPFRRSETDLGRSDKFDKLRRQNLTDVLFANLKRSQEAARVLEEVTKINDQKFSAFFKRTRFSLYDLEKKLVLKIYGRE
uniref:Thiamine-phosphate pyrophosphorylase n=1 Tax=candidate division WOR-3 bacterium TaxID=2052148 RepID=A0A7C6EEB3_UNCW3